MDNKEGLEPSLAAEIKDLAKKAKTKLDKIIRTKGFNDNQPDKPHVPTLITSNILKPEWFDDDYSNNH